MERLFHIVAVTLMGIAAYLYWEDAHSDWTFAVVVVSVSSFFLAYRFRLKNRLVDRTAPNEPPD